MQREQPRDQPSGTVTFLFTDVAGSTRLWASDEAAMSASLVVHDAVVRDVIESHGGYVFGTAGDSFNASFSRSTAAIEAARALQERLTAAEWPGPELSVRVGIHIGEAEERDGNYFGPVVNVTSRIEHAANAGQTLLTDAVRVASRATDTTDLGLHRLRDVDDLVHLHQLGDAEFPALDTGDSSPVPTHTLPRAWLVVRQPGRAPETLDLVDELTIGRDVGRPPIRGHFATTGDPTVSRLHAVMIPRPTGWCVQATSATNGLFVNGTRLSEGAVHLLSSGDELRLGERTLMTFNTVADTGDRSDTATARPIPELTRGERRVLLALCSPVLGGDAFTPPATVAAIADELTVSESAVKQQLARLYDKFGIDEGPDRRPRLANEALSCGAIRLADLKSNRG